MSGAILQLPQYASMDVMPSYKEKHRDKFTFFQFKDGETDGTLDHGGETGNSYNVTVVKFEKKIPLGRHGDRWKDDIKIVFKK
jgi:hypothetical protein